MPNGGGRFSKTFDMTKDGFTGSKALAFKLKYIAQFNAMEEELRVASRLSTFILHAVSAKACVAISLTEARHERLRHR